MTDQTNDRYPATSPFMKLRFRFLGSDGHVWQVVRHTAHRAYCEPVCYDYCLHLPSGGHGPRKGKRMHGGEYSGMYVDEPRYWSENEGQRLLAFDSNEAPEDIAKRIIEANAAARPLAAQAEELRARADQLDEEARRAAYEILKR